MTDALQVCALYIATFAARDDVYSAWTPDGWRPRRETLTPEIVHAALSRRGPTISGYFPNSDNTTHVAALDLDLEDGLSRARRIGAAMREDNVPVAIEPSRRGAHLWLVMDDVTSARIVRRAIWTYLDTAGVPRDPKIEIRPVSDRLEDDSIGMALRLPLMPHPTTKQQFRLSDPDGKLLGERVSDVLQAVELAPVGKIVAAAERYVPPADYRAVPENWKPPLAPGSSRAEEESVTDVLASVWGVVGAVPGRSIKCPAHDDRSPSLSILPDDRRVICHSPSCELNNDGHGVGSYQLRKIWFGREAERRVIEAPGSETETPSN